jgi:guanidinobutyrase / D-arginase
LPGTEELPDGAEHAERGPMDASRTPRFAGPPTFALLPRRDEVSRCDVAVVGVPFDSGTSYRPGARFGPAAVRQGSRLLRPWHPGLEVAPFGAQQVADAGDIACNPFDIKEAVDQIEAAAAALLGEAGRLLAIGGDHTVAYPLLRVARQRFGPVALVHFDAHLDTWQTYFGAPLTHGTPFRRAAEDGLFLDGHSMHVGIRGPLYAANDLTEDAELGFKVLTSMTAPPPRYASGSGTTRCTSRSTSTSSTRRTPRVPAPPKPAASPHGNCSASCGAWPAPGSSARTWSRSRPPTTMRK